MKWRNLPTLLGSVGATICLICVTGQQVNAGELYKNWNYSIDGVGDNAGGDAYEINGLAIKETTDSIFVALTGGMPLTGTSARRAVDGNIGWGDLFFNFSGQDFQTASEQGNVFGIRFAGTNNSKAASIGVYENVLAASDTAENNGYGSLRQYYDKGWGKPNTLGTDLPTEKDAYTYLYGTSVAQNPTTRNTPILNVIGSGIKIGDINFLDASQLSQEGLDFAHFSSQGTQTIGFKFARSLFPKQGGSFISHVFLECGNDAVANAFQLKPVPESVPEPSGIAGIAVVGLAWVGYKTLQAAVDSLPRRHAGD